MQILHNAHFPPGCHPVASIAQPLQSSRRQRFAVPPKGVALILRVRCVMKTYTHDIVRRLLELQSLEERLAEFQRSHEKGADVQALIESLRSNLPVTVLINHDRMRKKDKASVAAVRHGVCTGCHLALAVGNVAALRRGDLRQCGNCGRFLYLVEDEHEQETSPAPGTKRKTTKGKSPVTTDAN